ncbi:cytochrome c oxidase assembly protein [Williamsia sterculiae]|nr:cytochrome c oxidase assembly protein [Williamsia sterculiae]
MGEPSVWGSWTLTPIVWALMAVASAGYLGAATRRPGWPVLRTLSWVAAMLFLVVAVNSSLAMFGHHLFWAHMVIHLVMITVVPLPLVLAQPIRLALEVLPDAAAARVRAVLTARPTRLLTSPVVGVPLYAAVLVMTHLTGFQQAMTAHMWVHDLELVLYLVSGYLLLLPLIGGEFSGHDLSYPIRFFALLLAMGPDTLVGVTLMMTDHQQAPGFADSRMGWPPGGLANPDALADQSAAGAIMWFGGDGLMMTLLVIVAWQWIKAEGSRADDRPARRASWIESARRQSLGAGEGASDVDLDDDDAALERYNAMLARLNERQSR